jgi:hypothetical protein
MEKLADQSSELDIKIVGNLQKTEVLYVFASRPGTVSEAIDRLNRAFGLNPKTEGITEIVDAFVSRGLIKEFPESSHELEQENSSKRSYVITTLGASLLRESIDALSEVILTMQLGLNERFIAAQMQA